MTTAPDRGSTASTTSVVRAGVLLGVGLGGFVDGIVLHQILQWHHMVSDERAPTSLEALRLNVTADGFFHAFTWVVVAVGIVLLWRAVADGRPRTWRPLVGGVLAGWGLFNLVEGIVDHHLLRLHRVRPDAAEPLLWDLGFLALGAALVVVGWMLARREP